MAPTRITVRYGWTHGAGKLGSEDRLRAPAAVGTLPSRLALSAEVPGDFPQSGELRGDVTPAPLRVCAPKRVLAVPHLVPGRSLDDTCTPPGPWTLAG